MNGHPPITSKMVASWAGPRIFRDGQALLDRGLVQEALYEPPFIRGSVQWAGRPLRTAAKLLADGSVESNCPCRDSTERGIICAHVVAVGLDLARRAVDPELDAKRQAEMRRAARLARIDDSAYIRRAGPETPGAVPAQLRLTVGREWRAGWQAGQIAMRAEAVYAGGTHLLDSVPRDLPLMLSRSDENLLFVLEDIAEGPARGNLLVSRRDFLNLLELHAGRALAIESLAAPSIVNTVRLTSLLRLDLDRETGELILMIHTELPFARAAEIPFYLVLGRAGWVFGSDQFWPIENLLPEPLHGIYERPEVIARAAVPRFVERELPLLSQLARVETDVTSDLFTIDPAVPRFRLVIRGSPASLAATLYAEYGEKSLVAGKAEPANGFAVPDPDDLLRYLVRNPERERWALGRLQEFGLQGASGESLSHIVGCREVLNFLGSRVPALRRTGWKVELEGRIAPFMEQLDFATPVVRVQDQPGNEWFEIGFEYDDGRGATLAAADVQRALRKGDAYLERDGRTILLDSGAINAMSEVFRDCASQEGQAPGTFRMSNIYAAYVKSSLDALDGVDVEAGGAWARRAGQQNRDLTIESINPPELQGVLRPYQQYGVGWLRFLETSGFCGILADDMGLGKTVQTLAWLQMQRANPALAGRPALIVCPTSLVENWSEEARRFTPNLRCLVLTGNERHGLWDQIPTADLVFTSYALLRRDVDQYLQHEFGVAVLDEAQHIKNRSTQNAITAKRLRAAHRVVLTGTPIENSVSDLWSIMDFLMPGYLDAHDAFHRNYEMPMAGGGLEGELAQARLRRKLHPFLLRRLKTEVAKDLPPKIQRRATCTLTPDQQTVYTQLVESSRRRLTDLVASQGYARCTMEVLKTLLQLRQLCCHMDLLKLQGVSSSQPSAKMDLFFELVDEALDSGHRILVFSQFVSMLTILRREIEKRELAYCYLDGATTDRMRIVHEFNSNRAIPLFLISLKAGGTGLNLTGADMVIHFDPWWNPAVEDQATDRAYRIGQSRTVYSIKLITKGTIEEKVVELQRRKQMVIDATLARDDAMVRSLTWEDVQELLRL